MIKVAYADVTNLNLNKIYKLLPESRKKKVNKFRFSEDKKLSAGAYLILDKMLKEENITNPVFKKGKYGKVYLSNYPHIYFNLSHSKNIAVCVISDKEVGIDIENINYNIDLNIAKYYFYNSEYENIRKSKNPQEEFFKYWVLKESYMKYTGLGFNLNLNSFEIIINNKIHLKNNENLRFNLFNIKNFKLAVCSHYNVNNINNIKL